MRYAKAIEICENINSEGIATATKLEAIETILAMETINAVKKETLLGVIRWFWNNCVEGGEDEE